MIQYNEGRWSIVFACHLYGSVMDRAAALAFPCGVLAFGLHHAVKKFPDLAGRLEEDMSASVHQGFTFILGFLIVFRCQQAYSRWWEAGTLMQQLRGDWFNAFSNMISFLNQDDTDPEMVQQVEELKHKMVRLFSLLYGNALRQVSSKELTELQFLNFAGFDTESIKFLERSNDTCEIVLQWIQREIVNANDNKVIKIAPPILTRVYNQLGQGIVKLNNARKINEFLVPYCLAQFIAVMLILHWLWTVLICSVMISSDWIAGGAAFVISFAFWGVNYIAVELENPYGDDPNDLPICEMQTDMNQSLESLMQPLAFRPPAFEYDKIRDDLSWQEASNSPSSAVSDEINPLDPNEESQVSVLVDSTSQQNEDSNRYLWVKFESKPKKQRFLSNAQREKWRSSPVDPMTPPPQSPITRDSQSRSVSCKWSEPACTPILSAHARARGEFDDNNEPEASSSSHGPRAEAVQEDEEQEAQVAEQEAEQEEKDAGPLPPSSDGVATIPTASKARAQARGAPLTSPSGGGASPGASNVGAVSAADRPAQTQSDWTIKSYEMSEDTSDRGGSKPRQASELGESAAAHHRNGLGTGATRTSEVE